MRVVSFGLLLASLGLVSLSLSSCSYYSKTENVTINYQSNNKHSSIHEFVNYKERLPQSINTYGEKTILVDPNVHAWGAYESDGQLVRAGLATAGNSWCPDIGRPCRTKAGSFHINSLGNAGCKSSIYPLHHPGAPMPYCMFFNRNQGLHGSYNVVEGNQSHGCVRMRVEDAEWVRYNFANIGTRVVVKPY